MMKMKFATTMLESNKIKSKYNINKKTIGKELIIRKN